MGLGTKPMPKNFSCPNEVKLIMNFELVHRRLSNASGISTMTF